MHFYDNNNYNINDNDCYNNALYISYYEEREREKERRKIKIKNLLK